eukprot:1901797-Prymnesium_polylepis.1
MARQITLSALVVSLTTGTHIVEGSWLGVIGVALLVYPAVNLLADLVQVRGLARTLYHRFHAHGPLLAQNSVPLPCTHSRGKHARTRAHTRFRARM